MCREKLVTKRKSEIFYYIDDDEFHRELKSDIMRSCLFKEEDVV